MATKGPDEILATALESSRNVKFGRGVVSKTSYVAALVIVVWIAVAWRWSGDLSSDLGLLIAGVIATGFAGWYVKATQNFAERNPAQALLEGAELLEWQRQEAAAKGFTPVAGAPSIELPPSQTPR